MEEPTLQEEATPSSAHQVKRKGKAKMRKNIKKFKETKKLQKEIEASCPIKKRKLIKESEAKDACFQLHKMEKLGKILAFE